MLTKGTSIQSRYVNIVVKNIGQFVCLRSIVQKNAVIICLRAKDWEETFPKKKGMPFLSGNAVYVAMNSGLTDLIISVAQINAGMNAYDKETKKNMN